jgi:hypothetical protein
MLPTAWRNGPASLKLLRTSVNTGIPAPTGIKDSDVKARLGFNRVGGDVLGDGGFAEIGFVGHVAGQRGVVAEDGVFGDLLAEGRSCIVAVNPKGPATIPGNSSREKKQ